MCATDHIEYSYCMYILRTIHRSPSFSSSSSFSSQNPIRRHSGKPEQNILIIERSDN